MYSVYSGQIKAFCFPFLPPTLPTSAYSSMCFCVFISILLRIHQRAEYIELHLNTACSPPKPLCQNHRFSLSNFFHFAFRFFPLHAQVLFIVSSTSLHFIPKFPFFYLHTLTLSPLSSFSFHLSETVQLPHPATLEIRFSFLS